MEDFTINEMQEMQRNLQEKYKDKWESIGPERINFSGWLERLEKSLTS